MFSFDRNAIWKAGKFQVENSWGFSKPFLGIFQTIFGIFRILKIILIENSLSRVRKIIFPWKCQIIFHGVLGKFSLENSMTRGFNPLRNTLANEYRKFLSRKIPPEFSSRSSEVIFRPFSSDFPEFQCMFSTKKFHEFPLPSSMSHRKHENKQLHKFPGKSQPENSQN